MAGTIIRTFSVLLIVCSICEAQPWPRLQQSGFKLTLNDIPDISALETLLNSEVFKSFHLESFLKSAKTGSKFQSVTDNCQKDVDVIIKGLNSNDTTVRSVSMRYVDAQSKVPHGILQGNLGWAGDYQECTAMDTLVNPLTGKTFGSRYFVVSVIVEQSPIPYIYLGICLPNSCSQEDARNLTNEAIQYLKILQPSISLKAFAYSAYTKEKTEIKGGVLATIVVSTFIILLVMIGTLVGFIEQHQSKQKCQIQDEDIEQTTLIDSQPSEHTHLLADKVFQPMHKKRKWPKKEFFSILKSFSFLENSKKLFGTETARGPLACLNGLRVISMWWVILGHTYEFALDAMDNPLVAQKIVQRFSFQFVVNGQFSVDSFFFLSGLLVAYLALKEIREKGKMNWVYFVCHRYWRLTPLYAFVILFFANIARPIVYGPFSARLANFKTIDTCKTYWWTNLLYINNMYPYYGSLNEECLAWSWYLANDMQFYLFLSPVVILLLWKARKLGILVTCLLIIGGVFSRGFITLYYGMHEPMNLVTKHKDDPWGIGGTYIRPYTRWPVYLVGMLTGYVISVTNARINFSKAVTVVGWCICTATGIAVVWGQYHYNSHPGTQMTMTASVFYNSLNRTAWGICLMWIVIACVAGKGGPVKHILSLTIWAPLGRLTYAAYLVHPIVVVVYLFNLLTPLHFTDLSMVYIYIGNLVMTYGIAFVVSIAVEAPMIQLEKAIIHIYKKLTAKHKL